MVEEVERKSEVEEEEEAIAAAAAAAEEEEEVEVVRLLAGAAAADDATACCSDEEEEECSMMMTTMLLFSMNEGEQRKVVGCCTVGMGEADGGVMIAPPKFWRRGVMGDGGHEKEEPTHLLQAHVQWSVCPLFRAISLNHPSMDKSKSSMMHKLPL